MVPRKALHDLLPLFDAKRHGGEAFYEATPVGREFGARDVLTNPATNPR
jgi:hypothetical protein